MLPSFLQTLSDSRAGEPRAESSFARLPRTHCPAGTLPVTPGPLRSSHRLRRAAALPLPRPPTCKQPDAPKRRRAGSSTDSPGSAAVHRTCAPNRVPQRPPARPAHDRARPVRAKCPSHPDRTLTAGPAPALTTSARRAQVGASAAQPPQKACQRRGRLRGVGGGKRVPGAQRRARRSGLDMVRARHGPVRRAQPPPPLPMLKTPILRLCAVAAGRRPANTGLGVVQVV